MRWAPCPRTSTVREHDGVVHRFAARQRLGGSDRLRDPVARRDRAGALSDVHRRQHDRDGCCFPMPAVGGHERGIARVGAGPAATWPTTGAARRQPADTASPASTALVVSGLDALRGGVRHARRGDVLDPRNDPGQRRLRAISHNIHRTHPRQWRGPAQRDRGNGGASPWER